MRNLIKSKKGFTLVELIVVIVIIAILAAALVTSLIGYINKASDTNALVEGNNVYVAAQSYLSEEIGTGTGNVTVTNGAVTVDTALVDAVNTYLGATGVVEVADLTTLKVDDSGTITEFTYLASNNRTVTFTTAGGWVVA